MSNEQQCEHTPLYADSFRGPERILPCLFCERDRLRAALAEIDRLRSNAWLPIETAPHSGIAILMWQPWKSGRNCIVIGHYANGWVDRYCEEFQPEPTHWMPLPDAPVSALRQSHE